jgi:hypothetical protein
MDNLDPDVMQKIIDGTQERLLSPRKYTPDPKKIPVMATLCPFTPTITRSKSAKTLERLKVPFTERLYDKNKKFAEILEKNKLKSMELLCNERGATFKPETSLESYEQMHKRGDYQKSLETLNSGKDWKQMTHMHLSKEQHNEIVEDKVARSIQFSTRFNIASPRKGIIESIQPKNGQLEDSRVNNGKWQWSYKLSNHTVTQRNVHEEKMSRPKAYEQYYNMDNTLSTRESFVNVLMKTDNGTKDMNEEKKEKVKEIAKGLNDPKRNPKFNLYFWPQFGKRMVAVQMGDKTRYVLKERARSREN